jgi:hypothetical protein
MNPLFEDGQLSFYRYAAEINVTLDHPRPRFP